MGMGGELRRVGGREEDAGGVGEEDEDEARNILRPGGTVAVGWARWAVGWGPVRRHVRDKRSRGREAIDSVVTVRAAAVGGRRQAAGRRASFQTCVFCSARRSVSDGSLQVQAIYILYNP
jgi:hypothetical protein